MRSVSRSGRPVDGGSDAVAWDGVDPGAGAFDEIDAVVHLAGEPIFGGLPTRARMERIYASRIESTRAIVSRIAELGDANRPSVLVCASAVGYYGNRGEERLVESSGPGEGTLAELCRDWESEAARAAESGVRVVSVRIGVVLAADGGALGLMKIPFGLGVGGRLGSGQQFFPWIHIDDLVRVLEWSLDRPVEGAINAVAPEAVRNVELTRALGRVLSRPTILPVPGFVLKAALSELADELLGSRRVVPERLAESGFEFEYPELEGALENLLA